MPSSDQKPGRSPDETAAYKSIQGGADARRFNRQSAVIIGAILLWTWFYNQIAKDQSPVEAFFRLIDTLSEDVAMGSLATVLLGLTIVFVFTLTKLYTQVISSAWSFRVLEDMVIDDLLQRRYRRFFSRLMHFEEQPQPETVYPRYATSVLFTFAAIYVGSWVYLVLFSEALFFVSWSAGVDLPIHDDNIHLLPTLALAIPFSARVMAWMRYRYTQDFADLMPAAAFVLVLVGALGYLHGSDDQKFFLLQVWENRSLHPVFLRSGMLLAFIPVFSEGLYWLATLLLDQDEAGELQDEDGQGDDDRDGEAQGEDQPASTTAPPGFESEG